MGLVNPYCTADQVKAEIRNLDTDIDVQITDAINQASRWIDDYKGRTFYQLDYTEEAPLLIDRFDALILDGNQLLLPTPIIEFVSASSVAIVNEESEETLLVQDKDYIRKSDRLIAITRWIFPCPTDRLSIIGTFGYSQMIDDPDNPPDLIIDRSTVPQGLPDFINRATILAAAAFSGHNMKEIVGLDGAKSALIDKAVPKTVYDLLGSRKVVI